MAEILGEIEAAYADIVNKPFTGYYNGYYNFDTTGNSRMVICFENDDEFRRLANEAMEGVNAVEERHKTRIWKGVVCDWVYSLYIAPDSEITEAEAQTADTFEVYRVEAVPIDPERIRRWPYVCNLYVRVFSSTKGSVE